jgi:hypothetical protein
MSRWFVWIGCGLVGIGLVPTLADYLPVDLWGFLTDPARHLRGGSYRVVPVETNVYFPSDAFIGIGLVVLIAAFVLKRFGR